MLGVCGGLLALEERLDRAVLLVELGKIRNEVLDDVHCNADDKVSICSAGGQTLKRPLLLTVRQGVDLGVTLLLNPAQASERVDTIDVHRA